MTWEKIIAMWNWWYKTCDLLLAPFNIFSVNLCNNTRQKIMSVHSLHYEVSNNHMVGQWHPFKLVIFINHQANTKSSTHRHWRPSRLPCQGCNVTKFYLPSIPIGCHAPPTDFSACSLALEFCGSLYIHSAYLLFPIFAFINLTCFSTMKNLLVYWLNTAQFCCK